MMFVPVANHEMVICKDKWGNVYLVITPFTDLLPYLLPHSG